MEKISGPAVSPGGMVTGQIDTCINIRSRAVEYNNKILVSDGKFNLGKNEKVNALEAPTMKSHKNSSRKVVAATHKDSKNLAQKPTITHEEEKIALILSLTGTFTIWYLFQ